ncbi:MAG: S8 family serine peptidase [Actinomycetota bacterium]
MLAVLVASSVVVSLATIDPTDLAVPDPGPLVSVIVRELPGAGDLPEQHVASLGGEVGRHIGIIDGFVAEVPASAITDLTRLAGVHSVTPDAQVQLNGVMDGYEASNDPNSMMRINRVIDADDYWRAGLTGEGVDVALIDSGVVPVNGLRTPGKILNGPDLSFESQAPNLRYLDTYGHGTHMAGIIGGADDGVGSPHYTDKTTTFMGVAPEARIVSIKVADSSGAVDVSQVLAGIDWVVQKRNVGGLNIRVLNLSFGTDGVQNYQLDPLTYAVEVAWRKGIVVVVAAGNRGYGTAKMNNPAYDPRVIAVGAGDPKGTHWPGDDTIPSFSSCGDGQRNPDLVAPGKSVVSLRSPGSHSDQAYPSARVGSTPRFMRGSGSSQAAAVVSGAAALLIQQRPSITPDQVKRLMITTAEPLPSASAHCQGAGMLELDEMLYASTPSVAASAQAYPLATGAGSLNAARGSHKLVADGVELNGEMDIFGSPWNATDWAAKSWSGASWSTGAWNGKSWSGASWSGASWSGASWSAVSWSGASWSGASWSGASWSGASWSGASWSGASWSSDAWE